jgi:hypothetical protein
MERDLKIAALDLQALSAYRLLQLMSPKEAEKFSAKALGKPLFKGPEQWEKARKRAQKIVDHIRPNVMAYLAKNGMMRFLDPVTEPIPRLEWDFSSCPKDQLWICAEYEYGREAVRMGKQ